MRARHRVANLGTDNTEERRGKNKIKIFYFYFYFFVRHLANLCTFLCIIKLVISLLTAIYWPIIAFKKHEILACVHVILRHFPSGTNWPPTCRVHLPCNINTTLLTTCSGLASSQRNLRRILKESKKKKGIGLKVCLKTI